MGQPATKVTLSDDGAGTATEDAAVLADMQAAMAAWTPHLSGLGTLAVQVNVVNDGQTGQLADGAPTVDVVEGDLDGRQLLEAGSVYELLTGQHLDGGSDITVDVNAAYLSSEHLGTSGAVPSGEYDLLTVLTHEIGHGLGIGGETSTTGSLDAACETMWDHFLAQVNGVEVFDGPNAEAVNGGPVAVTTLANGEGYAHLANSEADPNANDLMSGLGLPAGVTRTVSDLDLAILADTGVPVSGFAGAVSLAGTANAAVAGVAHLLTGLTLADGGALTTSRLTLTVAAGTGTLSALPGSGAMVATDGSGRTLVATGSLAQVQAQLAALDYTAAAAGSDALTLSAADGFGNSGVGTVAVNASAAAFAVTSVRAVADAAGPLGAGHTITFTVSTAGAGVPGGLGALALTLNDGGSAGCDAAASTPTSLVFTSTVLAGQDATDLTVTGLVPSAGAMPVGAAGDALTLALPVGTPGAASGIVVDTRAPAPPTLALLGGGATVPLLGGTAEAGSMVTLLLGGVAVGSAVASAAGSWSVAPGGLPAGGDVLDATATDAAGNVSAASAPVAVTVGATTATAATAAGPVVLTDGGSFSADAGADVVMATGGSAAVTASAAAGSGLALFAQGGSVAFTGGGGAAVVVGDGAAALSLAGGTEGSSLLAFAGGATVQYAGGAGVDEIVGGAGALTVAGGAGGSLLVFGGTGALTLQGGGERDLVVGGAGAETVHAGAGGAFGGSGGSLLFANGSGTFLAGNTGGDRLTASAAGGDILAAGAGTETLDGGAAAAGDVLFGGTGSDLLRLGAGADTAVAGSGGGTIVLGTGSARVFLGGGAAQTLVLGGGGADAVSGFRPGTDRLELASGLTATEVGNVMSLSDGTRVTLTGMPVG